MHHLTNVIFHIINTFLLFLVLERMTGAVWKSAAVAALFALHPLHVESVAWVSERKDVLSTLFWMLTMMGYSRYVESRTVLRYLLVVLFYVLGLLAKPMLVTLPFVLLLVDFWPMKRASFPGAKKMRENTDCGTSSSGQSWTRPSTLLIEKVPLIVLALMSSVVTIYAQGSRGAIASQESLPMGYRITNAVFSYAGYLRKMIWPFDLAVFYPYPDSTAGFPIVIATILLLLVSLAAVLTARRFPYIFTGWFWYVGTLVPVIGIVQVGSQAMADRYTYVPLIGVFIVIVWGLSDICERLRFHKAVPGALALLVITLLVAATWVQAGFWKNNETLFSHALKVTRDNAMAHINLGLALAQRGDMAGAIVHYRESIRIVPLNAKAYINLGEALGEINEQESAVENYHNALNIDPHSAVAHAGLATLLAGMDRPEEAISHFKEALKIDPNNTDIRNNLGNVLLQQGDLDGAIGQYAQAVEIDHHQAEAYNNLGTAYVHKGDLRKSIENYQKALRERPDYADAKENLTHARSNMKILEGQAVRLHELIKADPLNPVLHTRLGDVYRQLGDHDEAIRHYRETVSLRPGSSQAMFGLVLEYSGIHEYAKALEVLQDMKRIRPGDPEIYYNIACIYAKQNMVKESIAWLEQAMEKGFQDWKLIKKDPDLINIRDTGYFEELMRKAPRK